MPYGRHKGTRLGNVPAKDLLWLYENNRTNNGVREYIEENLDFLNKEAGENVKLKEDKSKNEKIIPDCTPIPFKNLDTA